MYGPTVWRKKIAIDKSPIPGFFNTLQLFDYSIQLFIWYTMVWNPFSQKPPQQVEQKSHQPLNLAPAQADNASSNDISHTLDQLSGPVKVKNISPQSAEENDKSVTNFVEQRPANLFIIDGEKYSDESIICTNNEKGGKTCLKLGYNSIQLFKHMQKLEYFCSLPNDVDATYFECRKIK